MIYKIVRVHTDSTTSEGGFAFVPILILLIGFSTVALSLHSKVYHTHLAIKAEKVRLEKKLSLQTALTDSIVEILKSKQLNENKQIEIGGRKILISVHNEQEKLDINRSKLSLISEKLEELKVRDIDVVIDVLRYTREGDKGRNYFSSVHAWAVSAGIAQSQLECIFRTFTTYASSFDPFKGQNQRSVSGGILSFRAEFVDAKDGSEVATKIVLFTGDSRKPVWLLWDGMHRKSAGKGCKNEIH